MGEVEVQTDLAAWLLAQVQADEDMIDAALHRTRSWSRLDVPWLRVKHIQPDWRKPEETLLAVWDPNRLIAECDTRRRIVAEHEPTIVDGFKRCGRCGPCPDCAWDGHPDDWPCGTLRVLALPYADRPGYREEWRPA